MIPRILASSRRVEMTWISSSRGDQKKPSGAHEAGTIVYSNRRYDSPRDLTPLRILWTARVMSQRYRDDRYSCESHNYDAINTCSGSKGFL